MGPVLSAPVELVRVQRHGSDVFRCGVAEMQGWRSGHEDAHDMRCKDNMGSFWVLDGHGGDGVALAGAPKLGEELMGSMGKGGALPENDRIDQGLVTVDKALRKYTQENPDKESGSTVVGALCTKTNDGTYSIKLVNCGDSRGIVVRGPEEKESSAKKIEKRVPEHLVALMGDPEAVKQEYAAKECEWPLIQESIDHKPSHPTEKQRIVAAGGHVTEDQPPRLDGNLAVSRGLGDFEYKQGVDKEPGDQKVSCIPDIYELHGIQPGSILVLCCDGVWDVMTSMEVGLLVRERLTDPNFDLGEIAAEILSISLQKNSRDNITAMVVQLDSGKEWAENPPADEMKNFDKLQAQEDLDDEVRKQYMAFLRKAEFPPEPCTCAVCSKWQQSMMQCPCKTVNYCNKQCQKKGWKKHKHECPLAGKN